MATYLLRVPSQIPVFIKERRWEELAVFADYMRVDVPRSLAATDQALFRTLRNGVTTAHIMGFGHMNGDVLMALAAKDAAAAKKAAAAASKRSKSAAKAKKRRPR